MQYCITNFLKKKNNHAHWEDLPQTFCGANTDIGTTHNRVDHFDDEKTLQAISGKKSISYL